MKLNQNKQLLSLCVLGVWVIFMKEPTMMPKEQLAGSFGSGVECRTQVAKLIATMDVIYGTPDAVKKAGLVLTCEELSKEAEMAQRRF